MSAFNGCRAAAANSASKIPICIFVLIMSLNLGCSGGGSDSNSPAPEVALDASMPDSDNGSMAEPGFNDEFDVNSINDWSLRHQVEGTDPQYSVLDINQSVPGALTIIPTLTPGWFADGDAPLLFKTVTGNFSIETEVTAQSMANPGLAPTADFNSAGLMARDPRGASGPENHLMVNIGRQDSSIDGAIGSESKSTMNSVSDLRLEAGTNSGRLILCRVGNEFFGYRLLDNETEWTEIGTITREDMPATVQAGMVANGFSGPDLRATFNYIRMQIPASEADCTAR